MANPGLVRIKGQLQWECFNTKSGYWIGVCEPLKLTLEAETYVDLMEDIGHALDAMLQDLLGSNELERFLRDHGWVVDGAIPSHADPAIRFDVPFASVVGLPA